tara:strand:+ start:451 stop:732 length:282 start_codon:yes stop_codon:yes gene_type:complete
MAITKTTEIGQMEVVGEYKHVQVRTDTVIKEDGTELSRTYHRHVLTPGKLNDSDALVDTDISGEDSAVQSVCNAVWTDAVKNAWKSKLIADKI